MKKLINSPEKIVVEMCEGMQKSHPDKIVFNPKYKIIQRKELIRIK